MALVYKGLAPLSLLSTFSDERAPVIRQMLDRTTELLDRTLETDVGDPKKYSAAHGRPRVLFQLGVHCRWSPIVVDERKPLIDGDAQAALEAYGDQVDSDHTIFAGDRAPDAPGLSGPTFETTLFNIFKPVHHTALLFVLKSEDAKDALQVLLTWPKGTMKKVLILPKDANIEHSSFRGTDLVLKDKHGHAHDAYGSVVDEEYSTVIIRPDGVIGAILKGVDGLKKYYEGIFSVL